MFLLQTFYIKPYDRSVEFYPQYEERRAQGYEVWVDVYPLTRFLYQNRSEVEKVEGTKEWKRVGEMRELE